MRILLLFDLHEPPPRDQCYEAEWNASTDDAWRVEVEVTRSLEREGHSVQWCGVFDSLSPLDDALARFCPDIVFNLAESFRGERAGEGRIASYLELRGVSFTGADSRSLQICKDKAITKALLRGAGLAVPRDGVFPAIVKPRDLESSAGISVRSIVRDLREAEERARELHRRHGRATILEEAILGREFFVGVLETSAGLMALAPIELRWKQSVPAPRRILTERAKWDDSFRKANGVRLAPLKPGPDDLGARLRALALDAWRALGLSGYARFDARLRADGAPVILEANPNPSLGKSDEFALGARALGWSYDRLLRALTRFAAEARTPARRSRALLSKAPRASWGLPSRTS